VDSVVIATSATVKGAATMEINPADGFSSYIIASAPVLD